MGFATRENVTATQRVFAQAWRFRKISRGHKKLPPGDFLVFLTGQNEIAQLSKRLRSAFGGIDLASGNKVQISANDAPVEVEDIDFGEVDDVDAAELDEHSEDQDEENAEADSLAEEGRDQSIVVRARYNRDAGRIRDVSGVQDKQVENVQGTHTQGTQRMVSADVAMSSATIGSAGKVRQNI